MVVNHVHFFDLGEHLVDPVQLDVGVHDRHHQAEVGDQLLYLRSQQVQTHQRGSHLVGFAFVGFGFGHVAEQNALRVG